MKLPKEIFHNRTGPSGELLYWDTGSFHEVLQKDKPGKSLRSSERALAESGLLPKMVKSGSVQDEYGNSPKEMVASVLEEQIKRKRQLSLVVQVHAFPSIGEVLFANDGRSGRRWCFLSLAEDAKCLKEAICALAGGRDAVVWPHGSVTAAFRELVLEEKSHVLRCKTGAQIELSIIAYQAVQAGSLSQDTVKETIQETDRAIVSSDKANRVRRKNNSMLTEKQTKNDSTIGLSHLDRLEAESLHIMREVMAQAENPVMLYSVGKDSSVMLHLAKKAFYPSPPPFPLMHVDTRWKFQEMYQFRAEAVAECGMELIVHINPEGIEKNINPFDHGSALHTDVMKTQGLKQALDKYGFDVAFGGARRDEEKSRAKERVFSFRTKTHRWDPKNQRPELWNLYNGYKAKGDSIRVFPLSNWTELDIWQYIYRENIAIVPLYYAADRPIVERDGMLIMVDDDRMKLHDNEKIKIKQVRFRTLGCYPLTGAVVSDADDLSSIVLELLQSRTSERQGRAIDADSSSSMEKKKQEGYF